MNQLDSARRIQHQAEQSDGRGEASRRQFLKASAASAAAGAALASVAAPAIVRAAGESLGDKLKVGLIGCGGRGSGAARQALGADKNVALTAMGDLFPDRLQLSLEGLRKGFPDKVTVEPDKCFTGFDAYRKVLESGVDVVILTTPPAFRPMHLRAAIEAGKHVFAEKPCAVDAPGVRSVLESAKLAKAKNLAFVAGFCWRYNNPERETFARILNGEIGEVRSLYHTYNTSFLWSKARKPEWSDQEYQLRNWLYYTYLSGDHLVEQAVHSVDKMAWAMNDVMPTRCIAHGGRQVRTEPEFGNIYDHFEVVYEWENDVRGFLFCRQIDKCVNDNSDYITGTKGAARITAGQKMRRLTDLKGNVCWKYDHKAHENDVDMYQQEHNELFASIRAGKPINDGLRMASSTMMAIMGRMSAYTGQAITWEQAMNSQEDLTPKVWELGDRPVPPVAMPGKTKFM